MSPCSYSDKSDKSLPDGACSCAFLCDNEGQILRDFGEHLRFSIEPIPARSLVDLIERGNLVRFLKTVHTRGAVCGEITIHHLGSARGLLLLGSRTPSGILVFATLTPLAATLQGDPSAASAPSFSAGDGMIDRFSDAGTNGQPLMQPGENSASILTSAIHELRNAISTIVSSCDFLTGYSPENLNPEQVEIIAGIESAARILLQVSGKVSHLSNRPGE